MKTFLEYQEDGGASVTEISLQACGGTNPCVSPYSIETCLAMLMAGAAGKTKAGLKRLIGNGPSLLRVRDGKFDVSNMIWADGNIKKEYVDDVKDRFGAQVDGGGLSGLANRTNKWVAEKTNNLIPSIMSGDPSPDTLLLLVNAIYFLCDWEKQFDKDATKAATFRSTEGPTEVQMMSSKVFTEYLLLPDGHALLKLTYKGGDASCTFCLPPDGRVTREDAIGAALLAHANGERLRSQDVVVKLPRFEIECSSELLDAINGAGTEIASKDSDFSVASANRITVSRIVHKAKVKCDEKGTEAAAVTGITMKSVSLRPAPPIFLADRPFGFVIKHVESDVPLFIGAVCRPS